MLASIDRYADAGAFTATVTASGAPAYAATITDIARSDLDAWVASEGAAGRVVTALTASSGLICAYSFSRSGDTTSYETQVLDATELENPRDFNRLLVGAAGIELDLAPDEKSAGSRRK